MKPPQIPIQASDLLYSTGVGTGLSTKLAPSAGVSAQGHIPQIGKGAREQNFFEHYATAVGRYLSPNPLVEWNPVFVMSPPSTAYYATIKAAVDNSNGGVTLFSDVDTYQSQAIYCYSTLGFLDYPIPVLSTTIGAVRKAVLIGAATLPSTTYRLLTDVSGTYYVVTLDEGLTYTGRITTTRLTSLEPNAPQLIADPAPGVYLGYGRVGSYVFNTTLTVNEHCGCSDPATSKPCLGVYNGNLLVGYFNAVTANHFRYKASGGAWVDGAVLSHGSGTRYVLAASYDSVRAVWIAVLSNGSVWEIDDPVSGTWVHVSYDLPTVYLGASQTHQQAFIYGQTIIVQSYCSGNIFVLWVTEDSGQTWICRGLPVATYTSLGNPSFHSGGRRLYYTLATTITDGHRIYLFRSGNLDEPYHGRWS